MNPRPYPRFIKRNWPTTTGLVLNAVFASFVHFARVVGFSVNSFCVAAVVRSIDHEISFSSH